jgi:hypothetical protein
MSSSFIRSIASSISFRSILLCVVVCVCGGDPVQGIDFEGGKRGRMWGSSSALICALNTLNNLNPLSKSQGIRKTRKKWKQNEKSLFCTFSFVPYFIVRYRNPPLPVWPRYQFRTESARSGHWEILVFIPDFCQHHHIEQWEQNLEKGFSSFLFYESEMSRLPVLLKRFIYANERGWFYLTHFTK